MIESLWDSGGAGHYSELAIPGGLWSAPRFLKPGTLVAALIDAFVEFESNDFRPFLKIGHSAKALSGLEFGNCRQMNPEGIQSLRLNPKGIQSLSPGLRDSATLGAPFIKDQQP